MPYAHESAKLLIPQVVGLDRRRKLNDSDRHDIRLAHSEAGISIHELSRRFKVSRRTIQFVLFPERQRKNLLDRAARGGSKVYYDKDAHTDAVRECRRHRQVLATAGKLIDQQQGSP
jgi:transposase